ncbi:MAG: hypothetical protein QM667_13355 [Asticcacaulis sp.]
MQTVTNTHDVAAYARQIEILTMNISMALTILAPTAPEETQPFLISLAGAAENAADKANLISEYTNG